MIEINDSDNLDVANSSVTGAAHERLSCELKSYNISYIHLEDPSGLEDEYEFGELLGEGSFGTVFLGTRKCDGQKCAIKKVSREKACSPGQRSRLDREINILRMVKHPGIIELYAVAESKDVLFLITQLCEGDSLSRCLSHLPPNTGFAEKVVVEITRQVASAVSYLHNRGIIHRDLKADNIMLLNKVDLPSQSEYLIRSSRSSLTDPQESAAQLRRTTQLQILATTDSDAIQDAIRSKYMVGERRHLPSRSTKLTLTRSTMVSSEPTKPHRPQQQEKQSSAPSLTSKPDSSSRSYKTSMIYVKLIDFGLSIELRKNEDSTDQQCGTPIYMAPELLSGKTYTRQCDLWSLGILVYLLLTGNFPVKAHNESEIADGIKEIIAASLASGLAHASPNAVSCLVRLLDIDPAYRYSASELLLDPWLMGSETASSLSRDHSKSDTTGSRTTASFASQLMKSGARPGSQLAVGESLSGHASLVRPTSVQRQTNVLELMKQYHRELSMSKNRNGSHSSNFSYG